MGKNYSVNPNDYKLLEEVGYGASATVYRAIYLPSNEVVAVKCLDLDRCNSNLNLDEVAVQDDIRREAQTMSLIDHPNVIKAFCSFVVDSNLWVVMPFMAEGSCLHLMKIAYPEGFEESAIGSILKETLKALEYLHLHGHIHRDVKAGNILMDSDGVVKLADFGVSACMFDRGDRQRSRNTFVGTPCWMAPEVLQPGTGYDFKWVLLHILILSCGFMIRSALCLHNWISIKKVLVHACIYELTHCLLFGSHVTSLRPKDILFNSECTSRLADIWSFGITALELAHGHAPFSKYPPMKVLLMTIQNAPPGLDYDRDKRFSKSFKEMVAMCLVKDQTKRPTAEKLLKHSFFKNAKPPELSVKKLFVDLPPLWKRVKDLQVKDAAQLALKNMASADQEAMSQSEYQRGVSAWNFDVEDLKLQASLLQDEDEILEIKEEEDSLKSYMSQKVASNSMVKPVATSNNNGRGNTNGNEVPVLESQTNEEKISDTNLTEFDNKVETEIKKAESNAELPPSMVEKEAAQAKTRNQTGRPRQSQSGPLMPGTVLGHSLCEIENHQVADKAQQVRKAPSFSGPLNLPNRASGNSLSAPIKSSGGNYFICVVKQLLNSRYAWKMFAEAHYMSVFFPQGFKDSLEDKSKTNLVQIKGRFSVTSENVDLVKGSPLRKSASVGSWIFDSKQMPQNQSPKEIGNSNGLASILMPHLQNLFQQTSIQQDLIVNLLSSLQAVEVENAPQNGKLPPLPRGSESNGSVELFVSERERMLLMKISQLQARMNSLTDELTAEKLKYMQLQQRLNAASARQENGDTRGGDS
ncbi:hypothetical protein DH2020_020373 [Rehmannia glutinosa]|uniref:Protein kinase domain-containing protein n=1 Tax=Rehmannia glutinosa TaxID=99300 RepID=A0ABR0WJG3_REHGL